MNETFNDKEIILGICSRGTDDFLQSTNQDMNNRLTTSSGRTNKKAITRTLWVMTAFIYIYCMEKGQHSGSAALL
ncbi:MAG: hypothetical protein Roseis2KO_50250 [Roseivirga sp.]